MGFASYPGRVGFRVGQCLLAVVVEGSKQYKEAQCARPKLEGPPCNVTFLQSITISISQFHSHNIQRFFFLSKTLPKRSMDDNRGARKQTDSNSSRITQGSDTVEPKFKTNTPTNSDGRRLHPKFSRKRGKAGVSHLVQLAKCRHWQCSRSQEWLKFKFRKYAGLRGRRRRPGIDTREKKRVLDKWKV